MSSDSKPPVSRHDFAKALPAFDKVMRNLVKVSKSEMERRLHADNEAKAAKK